MHELTTDNVYGAIERRLRDENFNVLHLYRDVREDWGDDGGYIVSVSKKNDEVYLHILQVNYNLNVSCHILDENDERLLSGECNENDHRDYINCGNIEITQMIIKLFVEDLDYCIEEDVEESKQKGEYPFYNAMIVNTLFSYSEYSRIDRDKLLNLTTIPYVPDYDDPEEYYEDE